MNGTILWFNGVKDVGVITTEAGERVSFLGTGFADGERPAGRCAGAAVTFRIAERGAEPQAEDVRLTPEVAPRRARMRSGRFRSGW
jgi:cold shock CspA family protein